MFKMLKHRKPIVYVFMGIYALLSTFIIIESCLPRGISGVQSNFFAKVSSWFVNLVEGSKTPKSIAPLEFGEITDSSYLGKNENGEANIAIGTTTLVSIPVKYPAKANDYDVYNHEYTLAYPSGTKEDYNVVLSSRTDSNNIYYIDMRVVANAMHDELYQIDVSIGELKYPYKFRIVELAKPTNYECRIDKTSLKVGETSVIETKLLDEKRDDTYLRRYLDVNKLDRSSSNPGVATIDKYGVVHAISEGNAAITFGKYTYNIAVAGTVVNPAATLSLLKDAGCKNEPSLLDYDYVFDTKCVPNDYSVLVKASFSDPSLLDKTVSWEVEDNLKVKIAPYKYDENGYPIFKDDSGNACVRVCGYRKKGNVKLTAVANYNSDVKQEITLNVGEALPTSMQVNLSKTTDIHVNEQIVITGKFGPENVNNRNIHVEADESLVSIKNNDSSSVTITGLKVAKANIKVSSLANPELVETYEIEFTAKSAINEDNYSDFHLFIRKALGHFLLFMTTAIFGMIFFYTFLKGYFEKLWFLITVNLGSGLFLAGLSEFIQYFIPSRGGSFSDVGIDFLGYAIGAGLTLLVIFLINYIRNKKKKPEEIKEKEE